MTVDGHSVYLKLGKRTDGPFPTYRVKLMVGEIGRMRPCGFQWQGLVRHTRPFGEPGSREDVIHLLIERFIEKQRTKVSRRQQRRELARTHR